jgi:hypothetical protein
MKHLKDIKLLLETTNIEFPGIKRGKVESWINLLYTYGSRIYGSFLKPPNLIRSSEELDKLSTITISVIINMFSSITSQNLFITNKIIG